MQPLRYRQLGQARTLPPSHGRREDDECLGPPAELGCGPVDFLRRAHLDNLKLNAEGPGGELKRSKVRVTWTGIPQHDGA
jgi:hypothetical protein